MKFPEAAEEKRDRRYAIALGYVWGRQDMRDNRCDASEFADAYATRYAEYDAGTALMMPCIELAYNQWARERRITTGL